MELLMTLALASTVLMLGVPSFAGLIADQRMRAEADTLFHAVHLARKLSIVRRRVITLCASDDGETCSNDRDWSAGWIMFEDHAETGQGLREAGETLLQRHQPTGGVRLQANRTAFSLRSTFKRATNGTIRICPAGDRGRSRALVISYTGRPRVAYETSRGLPYRC